MKGAIARAQEMVAQTPNAWMPQQFENPANIEVHKRTTAQEILEDFPEGLDYIITGVGTGGHITGCAEVLKAALAEAEGLRGGAGEVPGDQRRGRRARTPFRASARASSRRTCTPTARRRRCR